MITGLFHDISILEGMPWRLLLRVSVGGEHRYVSSVSIGTRISGLQAPVIVHKQRNSVGAI